MADKVKRILKQNLSTQEYDILTDRYTTVKAWYNDAQPDIAKNVSVRGDFSSSDFDAFRPSSAVPRDISRRILSCMQAYEDVGIIKNVIDLMGDFTYEGLRIVNKDKKAERFAKAWYKSIDGDNISERFVNILYRAGNVIIRCITGKIKIKNVRTLMSKADVDIEIPDLSEDVDHNEIPWRYVFINPAFVRPIAPDIAAWTGQKFYGVAIPKTIASKIKSIKTGKNSAINEIEKSLVDSIPKDIMDAVMSGQAIIPLPPAKTQVYFYRKDDWQLLADPMLGSVLDDILTLKRMKLADRAALDTIISSVRLWRLGDIGAGIFPSPAAIDKLRDMLLNNAGGGAYDILWGPELDFKESDSKAYQFLGKAKYEPVLDAIYDGLGVPTILTSNGGGSSFNNAFVSLKTLIERLSYGRSQLTSFWTKELEKLRKARGFKYPFRIEYKIMNLEDEAAKRQLLLHLLDRGVITNEDMLYEIEKDPEIVDIRMQRERKARNSGKIDRKAGPFHEAQYEEAITKVFAQSGVITPSEAGVELEKRKDGEESKQEQLTKIASQKIGQSGESGQGRPKGSTDKEKRKTKTPAIRTSATEFVNRAIWARDALEKVSDIVSPAILSSLNKTSFRNLTEDEYTRAEELKFGVLLKLVPFATVSDDLVFNTMSSAKCSLTGDIRQLYVEILSGYLTNLGREPNIKDMRYVQSAVYAILTEKETIDG